MRWIEILNRINESNKERSPFQKVLDQIEKDQKDEKKKAIKKPFTNPVLLKTFVHPEE